MENRGRHQMSAPSILTPMEYIGAILSITHEEAP